ncbi:MAG: glycosyltransferase family 39 protein [Planctomycetes bacterium]|nr:glycosyltransferase family 39 protein [Planctomycetota bacterium]
MAKGHSWLIPEFNGEPRVNKPPLFYWLVAVSDLVCGGSSEVSARLPSIVMGFCMLVITVWVGWKLYGEATGLLAGLILCTSPLFFAICRGCVIDQTFSTLLSAGLFCILLGITGQWPWIRRSMPPNDPSARGGVVPTRLPFDRSLVIAGLFAGLAFMAKGTAAVLVAVVPGLFVFFFCRGGIRAYLQRGRWPAALTLALALSVWWYAVLCQVLGIERFKNLVLFEVVGRLTGQVHKEPIYYYLINFPAVFFPWSVVLISSIGIACRRVQQALPLAPAAEGAEPDPQAVRAVADPFLAAWVLGVLIFFSVPAAKLATYVLPAFPAAALLTARLLMRLRSATEPVGRPWRVASIAIACVFGAAIAIGVSGVIALPKDIAGTLEDMHLPPLVLAAALATVTAIPWSLACGLRRAWIAYASLAAFVTLSIGLALPLSIDALYGRTNKRLALQVLDLSKTVNRCMSMGCQEESLVYYLDRPVREARRPDAAKQETFEDVVRETLNCEPPGKLMVFVHKRYFQIWMKDQAPPGTTVVTRNQHIVVLLNKPPEPGSTPVAEKKP